MASKGWVKTKGNKTILDLLKDPNPTYGKIDWLLQQRTSPNN